MVVAAAEAEAVVDLVVSLGPFLDQKIDAVVLNLVVVRRFLASNREHYQTLVSQVSCSCCRGQVERAWEHEQPPLFPARAVQGRPSTD